MGRSQRHKVIIQFTDSCGKGLSEKQPALRYINQFANSQAFSNWTGPAGGALKGSTMCGFPPTLIPLPGGLEAGMMSEALEGVESLAFTDNGQFNLSGNPRYENLPESNVAGPQPGPDPAPGEEPTLNSINPSSAKIGSADLVMNVNGNNFTETSLIFFNGGAETTTFVSSGQLQTTVKPSTASVPGSYPVWVQQGSFKTVVEKSFTFTDATVVEERIFPIGPFMITKIDNVEDGLAITLPEGSDVRAGDTVLVEATGNTSVNSEYLVVAIDTDGDVLVESTELLTSPIEARGRLTVTS